MNSAEKLANLLRSYIAKCHEENSRYKVNESDVDAALALVNQDTAVVDKLRVLRQRQDELAIEIRGIELQAEALQAECPHLVERYQGDPAGGSDSHHICETCGRVRP